MSPDELRAKYEWISDFTLTAVAVEGVAPEAALRALVPAPTKEVDSGDAVRAWAEGIVPHPVVVDAESIGNWTLLTTASVTAITRRSRLLALSQQRRVLSLISSNVVPNSFKMFENGELRRQTEPDLVTDLHAKAWVGEPLSEEEDLPFERVPGLGIPSACEVFERLTGIAIRGRLFAGSLAVGIAE